MNTNFEFVESKISDICNSIEHIAYLSKDDYMQYSDTQKRRLINLIDFIDISVISEFKDELVDLISEYDFNICGDKNIEVCLQFQYSSEDDETVTYEYTIDGGGTTNTIEISKESIIEQLNKGEEISDIILSEIECNSF